MSLVHSMLNSYLNFFLKSMEATKSTVVLSDIRLPLIWTGMKAKSGRE